MRKYAQIAKVSRQPDRWRQSHRKRLQGSQRQTSAVTCGVTFLPSMMASREARACTRIQSTT
ncbi:unnamed protein product [Ixodes pacificus]